MPVTPHRRSIAHPVTVSGVGLHSGATCTLEFVPAPRDTGVVFVRADLPGAPEIPASIDRVSVSDRRTVLRADTGVVSTVEHVMAAVAGLGISDLIVRLTGPEPPQMDGSALPFCAALLRGQLVDRADVRPAFVIEEAIAVQDGDARYEVTPDAGLRITVAIDFPHPAIGEQIWSFDASVSDFATELAGARTFGFAWELEELRHRDLIRGAQEEAGVLFTHDGIAGGPLRWPEECARHKTLDLIGDLALLGAPILGHIVAHRPSHRGNVALARAIASSCRLETARARHS